MWLQVEHGTKVSTLCCATLPINRESGSLCKQLENYFSSKSTYASCCMKCHERKKNKTGTVESRFKKARFKKESRL